MPSRMVMQRPLLYSRGWLLWHARPIVLSSPIVGCHCNGMEYNVVAGRPAPTKLAGIPSIPFSGLGDISQIGRASPLRSSMSPQHHIPQPPHSAGEAYKGASDSCVVRSLHDPAQVSVLASTWPSSRRPSSPSRQTSTHGETRHS